MSVGGESALRLDVPAGRLHAFGLSLAIDEAFVVLAALLVATFAFLWATLVLGRVWCGWSCPQTLLADLTRGAFRKGTAAGLLLAAAVSAVVAANVLWYFVSPYEFVPRLLSGRLGPVLGWSWLAVGGIVFLDLALVRETFCATVCPYAKLQGVLFDRHTLAVAYDARRAADCVDCGACVRVCPTGIDIRDGLQAECIACARCIDACTPIMAKLRRAPDLVGFFHGEPGTERRPFRAGALALGAATLVSVLFLGKVLAGRETLALSALRDETFRARRAADGRVVSAYTVALENRRREPVEVVLALRAGGAEVEVRPASVALAAGERRQVRVVATVRGLAPGGTAAELVAEAYAGGRALERAREPVGLVLREAP